jgi:hypothetical protein
MALHPDKVHAHVLHEASSVTVFDYGGVRGASVSAAKHVDSAGRLYR